MKTTLHAMPCLVLVAAGLVVGAHAADLDFGDPVNVPAPPAGSPGFPSRDPNLDALPGFQNPPPGYGEVPFWWWTGDPLDKERLRWQIEQLHAKGIAGMQVNYAHEDTPGWLTYAAEPEIFSEAWWDVWKSVADECGKRGMGIGLSGYTLDWPNGKSLISRTIYEPEIQGREIAIGHKQRVAAGQTLACELPADTVAVRAYSVGASGIGPSNGDLMERVQNQRLDWTPAQGDWEVWVFTAAQARHAQLDSSAGRAASRGEILPAVPRSRPGAIGRGAELLLPRRAELRRRRSDLDRRPG